MLKCGFLDMPIRSALSSVDVMRRVIAYDRRAFQAYERGIRRLGWADATLDRQLGHLSFKDTLVHILNVHEALLVAVAQGRPEVWDDPARKRTNVKSWADLRRYRVKVWKGIDDLLAGLSDAGLGRTVKVPWFSKPCTVEDLIFQASFEQAHHLGEIIGAYWQMDRSPPQMMFVPIMLGIRASVR